MPSERGPNGQVVAIVVGVTAVKRHQALSERGWEGEEGMPVVPALLAAPAIVDGEPKGVAKPATFVAYRLAEARREAKAGAFDAAFGLVDELAQQQNLSGDERLAVQRTRSEIQASMAAAFTEHMDRSRGMYEAGDEAGALRLLDLTIATFPQNTQTKDAADLASAIRAVLERAPPCAHAGCHCLFLSEGVNITTDWPKMFERFDISKRVCAAAGAVAEGPASPTKLSRM